MFQRAGSSAIALTAIATFAGAASAQTALNPSEKDLPDTPKIYSTDVERTIKNKNYAVPQSD